MRPLGSPQNLVILAGYALGAAALSAGLPGGMPPSWSAGGRGPVSLGAPMAAFLLPTAAAVTDLLLRGLCVRDRKDEPGPANGLAIHDAIMLRFTIFLMGVHAMVLAALLGLMWGHEWVSRIVPLMLGLTMISIGNLLPRTRPNLAIGLRTARTLSDRALWIRMHRSAGYIVVALGAVLVLSAIAAPAPIGSGMIFLAGPAAIVGAWLLIRRDRTHAHG